MRTVIVLVLRLAGCAPLEDEHVQSGDYPGAVWEFHLKDGTRCVATKLGYSGGVSCDFTTGRR